MNLILFFVLLGLRPAEAAPVSIIELLKCICDKPSTVKIQDESNGFIKIEDQYCGDLFEGYKTFHLFKNAKEKDSHLLVQVGYECGPACKQSVQLYEVTNSCQITIAETEKYFPGVKGIFSFPRKGKTVFIADVGGETFESETIQKLTLLEKYSWKKGAFVKDRQFKPQTLPEPAKKLEQYFHY